MNLKDKFIAESSLLIDNNIVLKYLIMAVQLPTGAVEIITNTQQLESKIEYYKNTYDDNFCLKSNNSIRIIGFMLI